MKILNGKIEEYYHEIISALKNDGTVVFAFDTVYGLVADPRSEKAIDKIYRIKGRDFKKPIALVFADMNDLDRYVDIDSNGYKKIKKLLPGSYTLIAKNKHFKFLSKHYEKLDDLGFRIPDNKVITELIKEYDSPIAATSANVSGMDNCWSASSFLDQIQNQEFKPDLVIDSGKIEENKPSKVIDLTNNKVIRN